MKSKAGYWIGGGLMVLALLGSILYGFLSLKQTARTVEAFQRVGLPGTATVELEARKALALGDSVAGGIVRTVLGAFAVGGVLGVSGLILVIVTGVRHAVRHARRPPGA